MLDNKKKMPVIALRDIIVLPGVRIHFDIKRRKSTGAALKAIAEDEKIFIATQKDPETEEPDMEELHKIGTIASIKQVVRMPDETLRVLIEGEDRGALVKLYAEGEKPLMGDVLFLETDEGDLTENETIALIRGIRDIAHVYALEHGKLNQGMLEQLEEEENLGRLLDLIAANFPMTFATRLEILHSLKVVERYQKLAVILQNEIEILRIRKELQRKVKESVDSTQKDFYLREQLKVIQEELGETDTVSDSEKYMQRLEKLKASKKVKKKIREEIKRFKKIPSSSSDSAVSRNYIETLLAMPWKKQSKDNTDFVSAKEVLENDHYGMRKVKDRILEYLAVRNLTEDGKAPIICLVGPPGTGKTSVAQSVARALHKKYVRICLGGVRDEAEIRGHRRTYVGSMPGRIAAGIRNVGVNNPLILFDEIDKIASDYKGDPASALLEVLDSEQNNRFSDHYLEVPLDLSHALFICTANTTETIPRPLLDRMEIVSLSGYTENEKFHIAKQYLVKRQMENSGLKKGQFSITDKALERIISRYTREAGVRELERKIGALCRKTALEIVQGDKDKVRISDMNLTKYLGKMTYSKDTIRKKPQAGLVRGLAWTNVGGDTLEIQVTVMPGTGGLELTGKLGDVMKESAKIAISYVRSLSAEYKIPDNYYEKHDIHIHVPEGAVPKDGPSAGITMTTAFLSAVTGKKVRADVAMTGEVNLRGDVMKIGGLKEKLLAARLAGVKTVIVPKENDKDVEELDAEITEGMEIKFVEHMKQVLAVAFTEEEGRRN